MRQKQLSIVVATAEGRLQKRLVTFLGKNELPAVGVSTGAELDSLLGRKPPDVLVLDRGLKAEDGAPVLERLHGRSGLQLVVLLPGDDDEDRILALDAGADYYLSTPVNLDLLHAVIRRVAARSRTGGWRLQRTQRQLYTPGGIAASLTHHEVRLLETLARANGRVVSRRQLIEAQGHDFLSYDERRLEVGVSRLRKKIKDATGSDSPLKSEWGQGYAFTEPCVLF